MRPMATQDEQHPWFTFTVRDTGGTGVEVPKHIKRIAQLKSMAIDYAALGQLLDGLSKGYLKDWVDQNRR